MISPGFIVHWRSVVPWATDHQVEHDLVVYRFQSEIPPAQPLRLKIEINTREHFSVLGYQARPFHPASPWATGTAEITTYHPDELCSPKLRALYQREKSRDLFDLAAALEHLLLDPDAVVRRSRRTPRMTRTTRTSE